MEIAEVRGANVLSGDPREGKASQEVEGPEVPPASALQSCPLDLRGQLASASHLKVSGRIVAKQTQQGWPGSIGVVPPALLSVI